MSYVRHVLRSRTANVLPTHSNHQEQQEHATPPPPPPKPARTAFMCYSDANKPAIMKKYNIEKDNDDLLIIVAREWGQLSDKDRAFWDEEARSDKLRFLQERESYRGPSTAPKRRAKKHPGAPKRPPSAFLKFSKNRRQTVKTENPTMSNTDVSCLLGEMWRNASNEEREPYIQEELRERALYKENAKRFREDLAKNQRKAAAAKPPPRSESPPAYAVYPAETQRPLAYFRPIANHSFPSGRDAIPPPPPPPPRMEYVHPRAQTFDMSNRKSFDDGMPHDRPAYYSTAGASLSQPPYPAQPYAHSHYTPYPNVYPTLAEPPIRPAQSYDLGDNMDIPPPPPPPRVFEDDPDPPLGGESDRNGASSFYFMENPGGYFRYS